MDQILLWRTESAEETLACGRTLASRITAGSVVLLKGAMGVGKTTLAKGIVEGFGAGTADDVSSPTFTIMHEYRAAARVLHLDLYRLETEAAVWAIGLEDWLDEVRDSTDGEPALLLVEWGERFPGLWPASHVEIEISAQDGEAREIQAVNAVGLPANR